MPRTSLEALARFKASLLRAEEMGFDAIALRKIAQIEKVNHVHSAGNCAGMARWRRGVADRQRVTGTRHAAARPRARIVAVARMVLQHAALNRYEIDLFEVNEAYTAAVLRFMHHRGVPHEKVNVSGGAMAEKLQHAARRERGFLTGD